MTIPQVIPHDIVHSRSQALIDFAFNFALEAHSGQIRKYDFEPYINHPTRVAQTVASVTEDCDMIAASFLHDTIEDCGVYYQKLIKVGFMFPIADLVRELTDVYTDLALGSREWRKRQEAKRLGRVCNRAKTIKLGDIIDNTAGILKFDQGFAKIYMNEMRYLLEQLKGGDGVLWLRAHNQVEAYFHAPL